MDIRTRVKISILWKDRQTLEPRLGVKYIATEKIRLKISSGFYSQNILSTTSDRDVVNLFTGIISSPEAIPMQKDGTLTKINFKKLGI